MWKKLKQKSDQYLTDTYKILKKNSHHLINMNIADEHIDRTQATDIEIQVKGSAVGLRVREPECRFRDFTIRSRVKSGQSTELDKLKQGYGDYYLYSWGDGEGRITEYVLIDLHQVRKSGLLDIKRPERSNGDGTKFISISLVELKRDNCILDYHLSEQTKTVLNSQFRKVV